MANSRQNVSHWTQAASAALSLPEEIPALTACCAALKGLRQSAAVTVSRVDRCFSVLGTYNSI